MPIDHVELFVPRREDAAAWYCEVLGYEVVEQYRHWATDTGPLMISNDGGVTKIALFRGPPQGDGEVGGFRRVAFRVSAPEFLDLLRSSGDWRSRPLGSGDVQDHGESVSVYFRDPWGNLLEVTTYEAEAARNGLP